MNCDLYYPLVHQHKQPYGRNLKVPGVLPVVTQRVMPDICYAGLKFNLTINTVQFPMSALVEGLSAKQRRQNRVID